MGFPSPASDYVESRLDLNALFIHHPSATFLFDYGGLSHIVDSSLKPGPGDSVCYELFGQTAIGKLMGKAVITPDGEAIEGSLMEEVIVRGVVVVTVTPVWDDRSPF